MAYRAVTLKSESGDTYTVLVEYRNIENIPIYLKDIFDDEFSFISEVQVDSGINSEADDNIKNVIYSAIESEEDKQ